MTEEAKEIEQKSKEVAIDNAQAELVNRRAEMSDLILTENESEKYLAAANKLKHIMLSLTKPKDWVQFGETLHIQDQRLAELTTYMQSLYGLNVIVMKPVEGREEYRKLINKKFKDSAGAWKDEEIEVEVVEYTYTGGLIVEEVKEVPGRVRRIRTIEPIMGSCSTADKLWGKSNGEFLDPRHVQPSNVKKKAMANYRGNCLRYVWGLKGVTVDDLRKVFGDEAIRGIISSGMQSSKDFVKPEDVGTIEDLRIRILAAHDNIPANAREFLKNCTKFPGKDGQKDFEGYTDINRVKLGSNSHNKIIKALEEIEKAKGIQPDKANKKPEPTKSAAPVNQSNFDRLMNNVMLATDLDTVSALESEASRYDIAKTMTKEQQEKLRAKIGVRYEELQVL